MLTQCSEMKSMLGTGGEIERPVDTTKSPKDGQGLKDWQGMEDCPGWSQEIEDCKV